MVVFQDQVLEVAMALAGFTTGEAESLRRAMSRKRSREAMERHWQRFRDGAAGNGVDEETARPVFDKVVGFSEFGFPKSHAAAFAILAYQSAWLHLHHPAEFLCSLLNEQPMGFYPPATLLRDGERRGVRMLPPDVNRSGAACTVERRAAVRIGLGYVKGVGQVGRGRRRRARARRPLPRPGRPGAARARRPRRPRPARPGRGAGRVGPQPPPAAVGDPRCTARPTRASWRSRWTPRRRRGWRG